MRAAVILTTYNQHERLEKVLWGYAAQTTRAFELIVADDGSGEETREVIRRVAAEADVAIKHLWQERRGDRRCEILNRSVMASDAEYMIFSDDDCVPRRDFVETHLRLAERGRFLSGDIFPLSRETTEQITIDDVISGNISNPRWLIKHGTRAGTRRLRMAPSSRTAMLFDALTPGASFNSHNSSTWRNDLLALNGFDADAGHGGLDRAVGERLTNLGVHGKQVRHRAVCFHMDHERAVRDAAAREKNRAISSRIRAGGKTRARMGIAELQNDTNGSRPVT